MKQDISLSEFRDAFHAMNRGDNFSYEGLEALYNYLTNLENECGIEIELDVIALCCEYTEYESPMEFCANYTQFDIGYKFDQFDELDAIDFDELKEKICEHTCVIPISEQSFIIADF